MTRRLDRREFLKYSGAVGATIIAGTSAGCMGGGQAGGATFGSLMPLTGDLKQFGQPMLKGIQLGAKQVNENGGILGGDLKIQNEDTQTDPTAATEAMRKLVDVQDVPVVIGAAGSQVSMAVIDIAIQNEVVQVSPSNTSPDFTTYEDNDFYYRTCPSDLLQGKAMATFAREKGHKTANTLVINNAYGVGFEEAFSQAFTGRGGEVLNKVKYNREQSTFDSVVSDVSQGNPDVVMIVGYPETGSIILNTAYQKGLMEDTEWLLSEGLRSEELANLVGKNDEGEYIAAGMQGTTPSFEGPGYEDFKNAFNEEFPDTSLTTFVPNSYDALAATALAAEKAGEASGAAIKQNIRKVTNPPGEEVSNIGEALQLIRDGAEINFQGASSALTFDENGDLAGGTYQIWTIQDDGSIKFGKQIQFS